MIGILLAAGRGTRMKSEDPKVLFEINEEPLCFQPLRHLVDLCDRVVVVIGYRGAAVKDALMKRAVEAYSEETVQKKITFFTQEPPRGTGDAVLTALNGLGKSAHSEKEFLVLNGDLPLIRKTVLEGFVKRARADRLQSACLSVVHKNPKGLGRILRDETGVFKSIREEKDASPDERRVHEINGGVYFFDGEFLLENVAKIGTTNAQKELYLTDLLGNAGKSTRSEAILLRARYDLAGVNTTYELAIARKIAQLRLQKFLCEEYGVDFLDPGTAYISARTRFKGPCSIGPNVVIRGTSIIGEGVRIDGNNYIEHTEIKKGTHILWGSVLRESVIGGDASVGPMAHIRPGSEIGERVRIGNFVELKKTKMGDGAKASHLAYLGDALIGDESNIGCGTITCNYDGFKKHVTQIGKRAFVGSDTQLIAPVVIGDDAYIGSGTTVTMDVPAGALALSRPEMVIKPGYAKKLADRLELKKSKGE